MTPQQAEREAELPSITDKAFIALPKNPTMKDFNAKWGVRLECTEYEELENDISTLLEEAKREEREEIIRDIESLEHFKGCAESDCTMSAQEQLEELVDMLARKEK